MISASTSWRKSSYSGQSGSCVEVGVGAGTVGVRDTKDRHHTLAFGRDTWTSFITAVKARRFTT